MELESAIRATEILLGFAFALSSAEHLYTAQKDRILPLIKLMASALLCFGVLAPYMCLLLCLLTLRSLYHYQGPYNGGSDRMGALILFCLTLANLLPQQQYQELAFGYLAIQLMLSYFMAGYVKIINPDWRNGQALQDVFSFSAYPAYANLHALAQRPKLLFAASWFVILFELLFPLALLQQDTLFVALLIAALFHLTNAYLFGFNRFFWVWIAAYPSIIWLQVRIIETL